MIVHILSKYRVHVASSVIELLSLFPSKDVDYITVYLG